MNLRDEDCYCVFAVRCPWFDSIVDLLVRMAAAAGVDRKALSRISARVVQVFQRVDGKSASGLADVAMPLSIAITCACRPIGLLQTLGMMQGIALTLD
jgi:hypothetical protein